MLENRRHRPFVAHVLFVLVVVKHEIRIVFIYSVVCQMLAHIVQIRLRWRGIGLGGKPCQSFVVHIQPQRFNACKKHINSQIEFKAVYQVTIHYFKILDYTVLKCIFERRSFSRTGFQWVYELKIFPFLNSLPQVLLCKSC
jgi:hypothetical protein